MIQRFKREMSISLKEFNRLLPIAFKNIKYEVSNDNQIKADYGSGKILIETGTEQERKIASLVLPVLHVVFIFTNLSSENVDDFLANFDKTYHRGGG